MLHDLPLFRYRPRQKNPDIDERKVQPMTYTGLTGHRLG